MPPRVRPPADGDAPSVLEAIVARDVVAEARARERGTAVLRQFAYGSNNGARRLLREAGYAPAQHYFRLRADLAEAPPPADAGLRSFQPGDAEAVHELIEEAFTEIEGYTPMTLAEWQARGTGKAGHDPSLWLLAEDELGIVGAALGERWERGTGYVGELAVAARGRGRGLGRALLLGLFDAFHQSGLEHAELSVHGRNRGALALYESVGMRTTWEAQRWEKALGG